jgi:hypothetical protein
MAYLQVKANIESTITGGTVSVVCFRNGMDDLPYDMDDLSIKADMIKYILDNEDNADVVTQMKSETTDNYTHAGEGTEMFTGTIMHESESMDSGTSLLDTSNIDVQHYTYILTKNGISKNAINVFSTYVSPGVTITAASIDTNTHNIITYSIVDPFVVVVTGLTNLNYSGVQFKEDSGICIENIPGYEYVFEYTCLQTTRGSHGFGFSTTNLFSTMSMINWFETSQAGYNNPPNMFTSGTMKLHAPNYIKVTVPDTLGDLIISFYTDNSYGTLIESRKQSEVWSTDTTPPNNTVDGSKWKIGISTSSWPSNDNYDVKFGRFRKL